MIETTAFLLNPPRRAKHRRGRARRRSNKRGWFAKKSRGSVRRRVGRGKRRVAYTRPTKATRRRGRRRGRRSRNPVASNPRRRRSYRRRGSRRSRNPGFGGMSLAFPAQVLPFKLPLPGVLGDIANGIVQGVAAGGIVIGGYMISGALVNFVVSPTAAAEADAAGNAFKGKWVRPLLFAASAGIIAGVVSMVAPKGQKTAWSLLAAAGPAIRALGGVIKALMSPPAEPGIMQDIYNLSVGVADYLQVGQDDQGVEDIYEAGMGEGEEVEMSDIYEAGMGEGDGMEDYLQVGAEEPEGAEVV